MSPTAPAQHQPFRFDARSFASRIQHTLVSNRVTEKDWETHIAECVQYGFNAAMVPPSWVRKTAERLRGSNTKVASFVDLPFGTMTSAGKAYETQLLVEAGAEEIDLMPNVGFILSGMDKQYFEDIHGVVKAAGQAPVKVMLELPLLSSEQRERAVVLSVDAGAKYLKNASSGRVGIATPEDIRYLRRLAPTTIRVKASGGIKTAQQVNDLLEAGADLVGTSAGSNIMRQLQGKATLPQNGAAY